MVASESQDTGRIRLILAIVALALAPLAAPLLASSHPLAALLIRDFYSRLCHQNPNRSFMLSGAPVAVCVRCLGIYCGVAISSLLPTRRLIARRLLASALVLNLFDVATGALHWHGNLPLPRFLFGMLLGWAAGLILFSNAAPAFVSE